jgi:glycerophosphoryl diester phosphodiesterase
MLRGLKRMLVCVSLSLLILILLGGNSHAFDFPAAAWHRGDTSFAQENSLAALVKALQSDSQNIEVDIIDFIDQNGNRVGLVSHDYRMKRATGLKGTFSDQYHDLLKLPKNHANPELAPEPFMTVIDLFELIKARKEQGVTPMVSLDMKDESKNAGEFGQWVGSLICKYNFQDHVFASSFFKSNAFAVKADCPDCLVGGLVFNDHYALKYLDHRYSSLDLTTLSEYTFFLGFWGKKECSHDFILIQDDIFFQHPGLADYWKTVRKVKFVGVFTYNKERPYAAAEWDLLMKVDWLELDPPQMNQYLKMKECQ